MALTHLVKDPEIRSLFEPLLANMPHTLALPLKIPLHREGAGPLVGTAFDYSVRFELQRRYPNAVTRPWVAETVVVTAEFEAPSHENQTATSPAGDGVKGRWTAVVHEARAAVASYIIEQSPSLPARENVVRNALRLGRIDAVLRGHYFDPEPERVEPSDVADVLEMMDIVPWEQLGSPNLLWLNPTFGTFSRRVGGADADIISGDRLLDLKTTSRLTHLEDLRQLLGYLILARAARTENPSYPAVSNLGVYHARHGHLWVSPAFGFVNHPAFAIAEQRFFDRARELAKVTTEKVVKLGLVLDKGWIYYVDVEGRAVWRIQKQKPGSSPISVRKREKLTHLSIDVEKKYRYYFIDRDGDVAGQLNPRFQPAPDERPVGSGARAPNVRNHAMSSERLNRQPAETGKVRGRRSPGDSRAAPPEGGRKIRKRSVGGGKAAVPKGPAQGAHCGSRKPAARSRRAASSGKPAKPRRQ